MHRQLFGKKEVHVRLNTLSWVLALVLAAPITAAAQDFGVAESAETINRGNFKFTVNPVLVFGEPDNEPGIAFRGGYGFTDYFDAEAKAAIYEDLMFFGGDAEIWLIRDPLDVSLSGGLHWGRSDVALDTIGVDVTGLVSGRAAPRLDLYAALDLAFESIDDDVFEGSFETVHLVPGIEYEITPNLDFLAEVGIALNDDASHYLSGGLAFYLR
jgi:hypothetical protein